MLAMVGGGASFHRPCLSRMGLLKKKHFLLYNTHKIFRFCGCYTFIMLIEEDYQLLNLNTLRIKCSARYFVRPSSVDELKEAVDFARSHNLSITVLGSGSNVLLPDTGIDGLVINLNFNNTYFEDDLMVADAGVDWDHFVKETISNGYCGLENLSYIPGTVGACPVQNIGAYGTEVKDFISWVEVFDIESKNVFKLENEQCEFGYRDSIFKKNPNWIIICVAFKLSKNFKPNISYKDLSEKLEGVSLSAQKIRDEIIQIRKNKLPDWKKVGTAGSFFKNPTVSKEAYQDLLKKYPQIPGFEAKGKVKIPLAWVLDKVLGLRGYGEGNVALHSSQPLALINLGHATSKEVISFSQNISNKIFDVIGVYPDVEVRVL